MSEWFLSYKPAAASIKLPPARQNERLRIENIGRSVACGLKPVELPAAILEQLAEVVAYERGSFLLREGNVLRIAAQRGFPKDERTQRLIIPLREGDVYYQIADTCHPVLIDDVTQAPGWTQVPWLPLNLSWLGVPLFSKDSVVDGFVDPARKSIRRSVLMAYLCVAGCRSPGKRGIV
jgi:hypothetical protein